MSLFPRAFTQELSPIFRLMDDYANVTREFPHSSALKSLRSFQPKFDVSETKDSYTLHGELPGIEQKNINIEWTDGNTLTISGRTETVREEGSPQQGKVTETGEEQHSYAKPSVEDESGPSGDAPQQSTSTEVTKAPSQEVAKDQPKYWVSERSVGEFHRSFSFPARVDQDGVKAGLKNGVLEITVPKAGKPIAKKIEIQ